MYQWIVAVLFCFVFANLGFGSNKVIVQDIGLVPGNGENLVGFIALETPDFVLNDSKLHQENIYSIADLDAVLKKVFHRINAHLKVNISDLKFYESLQTYAADFGTKTLALQYDENSKQLMIAPKSKMRRALKKISNYFQAKGTETILNEVSALNQEFELELQKLAEQEAELQKQYNKKRIETKALGFWTIKYKFGSPSYSTMNVKFASNQEYYVVGSSTDGNWELDTKNQILKWKYSRGSTKYEGKIEKDSTDQLKIKGTISGGSQGDFYGFKVSNEEAKKILYNENTEPKIYVYDNEQDPSIYKLSFLSNSEFETSWMGHGGVGKWDFTGDKFILDFHNGKKIVFKAEYDKHFLNFVDDENGHKIVVKWVI